MQTAVVSTGASNTSSSGYLFSDNFSRTAIGGNWTVIDEGVPGWQIQNRQLCHPNSGGGFLPRIRVTFLNLSEFLMETDLKPGYVQQYDELGFAFRIRDKNNMYMAFIYSANSNTTFDSVLFQKMINGTKHWNPLHRIAPIPIDWVRLGIEVKNVGSDMRVNFQINGRSVWNYSYYQDWGSNPEFATGYVGLYMAGWQPACFANFDVAMPTNTTPFNYDLAWSPARASITANSNTSLSVVATLTSGPAATLTCMVTLPSPAVAGLSTNPTSLTIKPAQPTPATQVVTLSTTTSTPVGTYAISVSCNGGGHAANFSLTVTNSVVASFQVNPSSPVANVETLFVATISGGMGPYNCTWIFGDGRTGNGCPSSHIFSLPGSYSVTLIVTDHSQPPLSQEISRVVTVGQASPLPPNSKPENPSQPDFPGYLALFALATSTALVTFTVGSFYASKTRKRMRSTESYLSK